VADQIQNTNGRVSNWTAATHIQPGQRYPITQSSADQSGLTPDARNCEEKPEHGMSLSNEAP